MSEYIWIAAKRDENILKIFINIYKQLTDQSGESQVRELSKYLDRREFFYVRVVTGARVRINVKFVNDCGRSSISLESEGIDP